MFEQTVSFDQYINTKKISKTDGSTYIAWDVSINNKKWEMFVNCLINPLPDWH